MFSVFDRESLLRHVNCFYSMTYCCVSLLWRYPSGPVEERKKRLKKGGKEETFLLYASVETDINLNQILLLLVISDTLPCGRLS